MAEAIPEDPGAYRHWVEDRVRFADLDPLGHCNHAVISGFFESSRVALFADAGLPIMGGGTSLSIVRLLIEFRKELLLDAKVRVGARLGRIGRTSLTLQGALFEGERCCAVAEVVGVLIDLGHRRPVELPGDLKERLSALAGH